MSEARLCPVVGLNSKLTVDCDSCSHRSVYTCVYTNL